MAEVRVEDHRERLAVLTDRFLTKELTPSETEELLAFAERDPRDAEQFYSSVWMHLLISRKYAKDARFVEMDARETHLRELSWDELVQLQNAEKPYAVPEEFWRLVLSGVRVVQPVPSGTPSGGLSKSLMALARKCFWPNRHDLESSIAPVVTVCCIMASLLFGIFLFLEGAQNRGLEPDPITTICRVNEAINVVWPDEKFSYSRGQLLDDCLVRFNSGMLQLEMNNGTKLVLEGNVDLTIETPMKVVCRSGGVSVFVSKEATGFELDTPSGKVLDRGTAFFVQVTGDATEVEVAQGKVDYYSTAKESVSLVEGQSLRSDMGKPLGKVVATVVSRFVRDSDFDWEARKMSLEKQKQHEDETVRLAPILDFRFATCRGNVVTNIAPGEELLNNRLTLHKTRAAEGCLYGSQAISFRDPFALGRFSLNRELTDATVVVMVRIPELVNQGNVLLANEAFFEKPGAILWQVSRDGSLILQLTTGEAQKIISQSGVAFSSRNRGEWHSLAFTLDSEKGTITQFFDSRPLITTYLDQSVSLSLEDSLIGNFINSKLSINNRNLAGTMDSIQIYDRILSVKELQVLGSKTH